MSEISIRAPTLRIAGRIDLLERSAPTRVTVRDYKTGNVLEPGGSVRPDIALQLRLYGLALLELLPGTEVGLVVSAGSDHRVPFTEDDVNATREWLQLALAPLPAGAEVAPESLASPGAACRTCQVRHSCSAYLREAARFWEAGAQGFTLPLDTWGKTVDLSLDALGRFTLLLRDAAGRLVRIVRLARRPELEAGSGSAIWLFGLEASIPPTFDGRSFHPRNFHELAGNPLDRRAWALAVFR